jgi:hypothetical protein
MIHYRRIKKVSKKKFLGTFNQSWPTHTHSYKRKHTHTHTHKRRYTHVHSQITYNRGSDIEFVMIVVQCWVKLDLFMLAVKQSGIVIVSNASLSVSISFVNSLKSVCPK